MEVLWTKLCLPDSYVEALTLDVIIYRQRAFREAIRLNEIIRVGPSSHSIGGFVRRRRDSRELSLPTHMEQSPCEHTERRQLSVSQEEHSHQKLRLLAP